MVTTPAEVTTPLHKNEEGLVEGRIQRSVDRLPDGRIPKVREFLRELEANGRSPKTRHNYSMAIRKLCDYIDKPFPELTKEDMEGWSLSLKNDLAESSRATYQRMVKRFLKWLNGSDGYPKSVKWMKPGGCNPSKHLPEDILSKGEVRRIVEATDNQRDRTLIFVTYESGCRRGEVVSLRVGDVKFDQYGAVVKVNGKTGERRVRLVNSVPDLRLYLSLHHPDRDNPEAPLWPSQKPSRGGGIKGDRLYEIVRKASDRALGRKIGPHALRHSRATHLAKYLKETQMREYFGWAGGSDMPSIYVHMSGRDIDEALLETYGIEVGEGEEEEAERGVLGKVRCPACGFENPVGSKFCARCSLPLSDEAAFEVHEKREKVEDLEGRLMEWFTEQAPEILKRGMKETGIDEELREMRGE